MAILITGATGFLGRHILQQLAHEETVYVLLRNAKDWQHYAWTAEFTNVRVIEASLLNVAEMQARLGDVQLTGIYHLAALVHHNQRHTQQMRDVNITGTLNMVRLSHIYGCRMLFVSTSGTVGCFRSLRASADEHAPFCSQEVVRWPYYASKIDAEKQAQALAQELGVQMIIVRPPVMLGPGDHRFRSTSLIIRFLRGKLPFLLRGGFHFVDIRDAAKAMVTAMQLPEPRPVYHLPGTSYSVDDFFSQLESVSGKARPRFHLPHRVARAIAAADEKIGTKIKGEPLGLFPDPVVIEMGSRYWGLHSLYAEQELGFKSRRAEETLRDTVNWLRNEPALGKELDR